MSEREGLAPCPFCGSEDGPALDRLWHEMHRVICSECGAEGPMFENARLHNGKWAKDAARIAWNKRWKAK
ncbi:MAG: Lar family restriction alleviation protein [Betaproteobacteria bacterium]|nr:Lar family restriction alleviation protein [Betaproteobacteria bacterium]